MKREGAVNPQEAPRPTIEGTWGHKIVDELQPKAEDLLIQKFRQSCFLNISLDLLLRNRGIKALTVTGVVTQGCVLATALEGIHLDYFVIVVRDCINSPDKEQHEAALKVLEKRLDVLSSAEVLKVWGKIVYQTAEYRPEIPDRAR